jgi:hypothetical protein
MQNKANLPDAQMDISSLITKDYREIHAFGGLKNKAEQSQFRSSHTGQQKFPILYSPCRYME